MWLIVIIYSLLSKKDYLLILITIRGSSLTMPTGQNFAAYYGAVLQNIFGRVTDNISLLNFFLDFVVKWQNVIMTLPDVFGKPNTLGPKTISVYFIHFVKSKSNLCENI